MKRNFLLFFSTVITIIYLIIFPNLTHIKHGILLIMIFLLFFYTGKVAFDNNNVDFKYRIWINSLFVIAVLFPIFIAPGYFDIVDKFFRLSLSLIIILEVIKKEKQRKY